MDLQAGLQGGMATPAGARALFARDATGLVRTGSTWRVFLFNIGFVGLTYVAFSYAWVPAYFPGSNMLVGFALLGILGIWLPILYALFSAAMPRSGGDYVFLSRTLHPAIGFAANFAMAMLYVFWIGWGGFWLSYATLSIVFTLLGSVTGNQGLINLGSMFARQDVSFAVGVVVILLFGILIASGMKNYYRYQAIAFILGIPALALTLGLLLFSGHDTFVTRFNAFAANTAQLQNGYQAIIDLAVKGGMPANPPFDLLACFGYLPFVWIFGLGTAYIGGEVRNARRSQLIGMIGSSLLVVLFYFLIALGFTVTVGQDFNRAAGYLSLGLGGNDAQYPLTVPPYYNLWTTLLTNSVLLQIILALGFTIWGFFYLPQNLIVLSRMMLAWSLDRVMPEWLSEVHEGLRTPINAIIVSCILSIILLGIFTLNGVLFTLAVTIPMAIVFGLVGVAGILFPYLKKTRPLYESSGVRYEVLGIPLFTIAGILTVVYWLISLYIAISRPDLGMTTPAALTWAAVIFIAPLVIYYVAKTYRSRQGIALDRTFAEIPPE